MDTPARRKRRDPRTLALYAWAVTKMFRGTLIGLVLLLVIGAVMYRITPQSELQGAAPPWKLSLYGAWMALLAQPVFSQPEWVHIQLLQSIYPLFGLGLIGEGIVRFALLMVSRRRGEKEWMQVMASTYRNHVILCGLGHLGYRVLEQLILQKRPVVVIDKNPEARFSDDARDEGVPLIVRDMKDDVALIEAGIAHAAAVIIATEDDLANVECALDARRLNPEVKVAVRLFDQQLATKLKDVLAFDAPFSSAALAAPAVVAMAMGNRVVSAFALGGVPHVAIELVIERRSALVGSTVSALEAQHRGVRVLLRKPRTGAAEIAPAGATVFDDGDEITVHMPVAGLPALTTLARSVASTPDRS